MEILKFGDSPSPKRSNNGGRKPGAMIIAGVLVAMMGMSTTLAGTITIGTNNRVEFGQGIVNTAACDDAITVTPGASFTNTGSNSDTFTVTTLTLSGVEAAATTNCLGKYLTVKAYAGSSGTAMTWDTSGTDALYIKFRVPSTGGNTSSNWSAESGSASVGFSTTTNWTGSTASVTITSFELANSVSRFTVESSDS